MSIKILACIGYNTCLHWPYHWPISATQLPQPTFPDSWGPGNPTGSAQCAGSGNGSSRHTVVPLCVQTIFMLDVLNYFCLSNLELKATAYQFYHLLQRITNPLELASVVNLYREFRRMTQIWRWMKRMKWAGYGMKKAPVSEVTPSQLSVFCLACPQPGPR